MEIKFNDSFENFWLEIANVSEKVCDILEKVKETDKLKSENKLLETKVHKTENIVKKNNLLMMNLPEKEKETWQETEASLRDFFHDKVRIENAHDDQLVSIDREENVPMVNQG